MVKILAPLAGALAVLAAALAATTAFAAPCGPTTCGVLSSALPGARVLLVRPQGQAGPLVVYDLATGKVRARLPGGVLSANGRTFLVARNTTNGTTVTRFDAATGVRLGSTRMQGWDLKLGAVSSDGRYAALVDGGKDPNVSIVDVPGRRLVRKVHLDGQWAVDALSRDGRRLYLLEYKANGSYNVRVHTADRGLVDGPITDPAEPEPMTGIAWGSIGTAEGSRQLTLYLKSYGEKTEPFVHSLSLTSERADCIDLPGGDFMGAGRYALVLARDGRTLYAANASYGVVVTIDLRTRATSAVRFPPLRRSNNQSVGFGALAPDGKTLVFTAGRGLLAYDVAARKVRALGAVREVAGVGFEPSGRSVLVVGAGGSTVRLDAKTGAEVPA